MPPKITCGVDWHVLIYCYHLFPLLLSFSQTLGIYNEVLLPTCVTKSLFYYLVVSFFFFFFFCKREEMLFEIELIGIIINISTNQKMKKVITNEHLVHIYIYIYINDFKFLDMLIWICSCNLKLFLLQWLRAVWQE